jgi:alanyl-tRNA synthetase
MIFAQHPSAAKDMSALLKQVLAKVGGKGGGTRDFARGRLDDATQAARAVALAKQFLSGDQPAG